MFWVDHWIACFIDSRYTTLQTGVVGGSGYPTTTAEQLLRERAWLQQQQQQQFAISGQQQQVPIIATRLGFNHFDYRF